MARPVRRPTTPEARARAAEARTEKLAALHQNLIEQVNGLHTGEDWQRWLSFAARFHHYSFANTLLISAIGVIDDVRKCVTMDLKGRTNRVVLIAASALSGRLSHR